MIFVRAHNNQRRGRISSRTSGIAAVIEGFNGRVVCLPVTITRDEGPNARIFRIILPYKRLSSKLIAPTAHVKPNKCNRARRLYRRGTVADRARNRTRKFLRNVVRVVKDKRPSGSPAIEPFRASTFPPASTSRNETPETPVSRSHASNTSDR